MLCNYRNVLDLYRLRQLSICSAIIPCGNIFVKRNVGLGLAHWAVGTVTHRKYAPPLSLETSTRQFWSGDDEAFLESLKWMTKYVVRYIFDFNIAVRRVRRFYSICKNCWAYWRNISKSYFKVILSQIERLCMRILRGIKLGVSRR